MGFDVINLLCVHLLREARYTKKLRRAPVMTKHCPPSVLVEDCHFPRKIRIEHSKEYSNYVVEEFNFSI